MIAIALIVLGVAPMTLGLAMAQTPDVTLTIAATGAIGPLLEGNDPLNADGHPGTLTLEISESASPVLSNADYADYTVPAGAVTATVGMKPFSTTAPSKMTIKLGSSGDILMVVFRSLDSTTSRFIAVLAPGSFTTAALMHPTPFSPATQDLTAATSAAGNGSQLWYTDMGSLTVLGYTGSITNSATSLDGPDF